MGKDGTSMMEFTPKELKIIFDYIHSILEIGYAGQEKDLYQSIEQKIAKKLNLNLDELRGVILPFNDERTEGHEKI
jgi:hypothetical protein